MESQNKKIYLVLAIVIPISLIILGSGVFRYLKIMEEDVDQVPAAEKIIIGKNPIEEPPVVIEPEQKLEDPVIENKKEDEDRQPLPEKVHLTVPFIPQAPFQVWDPLHEDACEEASLLMVLHHYQGTKMESLAAEDEIIKKLIAYEEKKGYGISITLEELNQITKDYFKVNAGKVKKNITNEDIKRELASGRVVIVGAAGKILPNPNFRNGGPVYHMLVVIGYDATGFITNDPGTRNGKDYHYTYQSLYNAIHDWDPENIYDGQKAYLVFE